MKKLIYADDISERLERVIRIGGKAIDGEHPISAECVLSVLKSLPTVDAVEVVRCEDCRYWNKYPGSSAAPQYHECMVRISHLGNLYTTAGEYCSRGERKDGDADGV